MQRPDHAAKSSTRELAFGAVLAEIRRERGLSQEALGFESGYHRTYISMLERGQKSPSLATIMDLADTLHVRGSEMLRQIEERLEKRAPKKKTTR